MRKRSFHIVRDGKRISAFPPKPILQAGLVALLCGIATGCSTIGRMAMRQAGDALGWAGPAFASDDDPEFVRLAAPANLKIIESMLQEQPEHEGLLLGAASGFTQYAYAFIQQDGDMLEDNDIDAALHKWKRAKAMFLRARGYGLRGLERSRGGFTDMLKSDPVLAVATVQKDEVPFLFWTACAWGGAISLGKDDPELIAEIPQVEALIDRAYDLDPDFADGAIDQFLIGFEGARVNVSGDPAQRSRYHMDRVVKTTGGDMAAPFVAFAEAVSVKQQNRDEFEALLKRALSVDVDKRPEWRLSNLIAQQRARWLLAQINDLFLATGIPMNGEETTP